MAMLPRRSSVLVALSGGPDSVALLHLLVDAAVQQRFAVAVAHVNYSLRGEESGQDEQFCRELCRRLTVTLHVKRVRKGLGKSSNLQERARTIRYGFFNQLCDKHGYTHVATGHNQSDNVETVLMNLCRGAGSFGLGGIDQQAGRVIRPLLEFSRDEILQYLESAHISYRLDRSNLETKYTRNKVRQRLTPLLQDLFGEAVISNISRSSRIFAEHEQYLRSIVEKLLRRDAKTTPFGKIVVDLRRFRRYDNLLKRIVLAICFERLTGSLREFDFAATERVVVMIGEEAAACDLKAKVFAEVAGQCLYIYRKQAAPPACKVKSPGETDLRAFGVKLSIEPIAVGEIDRARLRSGDNRVVYLDAKQLSGELTVRNWRAGDRFTPLGMAGSKKLSDFFIDRKIDRPSREEVPLLVKDDMIAWVMGYEIADKVKVSDSTSRVLKLEVTAYRGI